MPSNTHAFTKKEFPDCIVMSTSLVVTRSASCSLRIEIEASVSVPN